MQYFNSNIWMDVKDNIATVGLADPFIKHIKGISAVNLPKIGQAIKVDEDVAVVESNKTAYDIPSPISGKIIQVNENAISDLNNPDLNEIDRWIFKVKI